MIGLFLGDTDFSEIVYRKIKKLNKKYFIIDFSQKNKFKKDKNSSRISIGKFGKIIDLIKQKKCKRVLFAGKIAKPNFSSLRLDFKGIYYMPSVIRAAKIGDAAIIKSIIKILNNEGIKVISSIFFNPELSLKTGTDVMLNEMITKYLPSGEKIKFKDYVFTFNTENKGDLNFSSQQEKLICETSIDLSIKNMPPDGKGEISYFQGDRFEVSAMTLITIETTKFLIKDIKHIE